MSSTKRASVRFAVLAAVVLGNTTARGLTINATYDSSITNDVNKDAIIAGITAAIGRVQAAISNNVTVNITFQEGGGLGSSSTFFVTPTYSEYRTALMTQQSLSTNDNTAIATLPASYPSGSFPGTSGNVIVTTALARALGLFSGSLPADSTITLNTALMYFNRASPVAGKYDLQAVAAHEIDEALGIGGIGTGLPTTNGDIGVLDLFRYSAPGTRSFTASSSATSYFSIDGGTTNIVGFNQSGGGSDYADWVTSATHRVQDAFGTTGVNLDIGSAELTAFDVVGWNLAPVPEPTTILGLALSAGCVLYAVRRRRTAA